MRITVDIEPEVFRAVQKATGITKKSPAIRRALDLYLREVRKRRFIVRVLKGKTDYVATNEELEGRSTHDLR
jgi:metal-responsive CopG/Arc/MetJ family transcriptional regulator